MDPASLAILLKALIPIVAVLAVFGAPVAFIFVSKHHKLRMKELEIEAQLTPRSTDARLQAIEERLTNIEAALTGRPALPSSTQERAALLEGPGQRVRNP
jgi:hypothetical protein